MKAITAENYHVRPFVTNKVQQYTYTFLSGSNPDEVSVDVAVVPPAMWGFDPDNDPVNLDGIYQRNLYASLRHLFYSSGSVWNSGQALEIPSGSQIYVINLAQNSYGERIRPGSFSLSVGASTGSIIDDGSGTLKVGISGSNVGHIFYSLGIATIQYHSGDSVNPFGLNLTTGSVLDITFKATQTIYEHSIICTMDEGEFNYTTNPSLILTSSASEDGKVVDFFASGSLTPYMTTVGLYTSLGQLVAIAKFPRPIKRASESQQTVVIRFDV